MVRFYPDSFEVPRSRVRVVLIIVLFYFLPRNFSHQSAATFDSQRNGRSGHLVEPTQYHGAESDRFHVVFVAKSVHGLDGQRVLQKKQVASELSIHQQQTGTIITHNTLISL